MIRFLLPLGEPPESRLDSSNVEESSPSTNFATPQAPIPMRKTFKSQLVSKKRLIENSFETSDDGHMNVVDWNEVFKGKDVEKLRKIMPKDTIVDPRTHKQSNIDEGAHFVESDSYCSSILMGVVESSYE